MNRDLFIATLDQLHPTDAERAKALSMFDGGVAASLILAYVKAHTILNDDQRTPVKDDIPPPHEVVPPSSGHSMVLTALLLACGAWILLKGR